MLFTFAGGSGHFEPLVPLARAAEAAGHRVAFSGEPALSAAVERAGFAMFSSGPNTSGTQRRPLLAVDREREDRALRNSYAGRIARGRAADLLAVCAAWPPDLLVCDEVDFGGMIAAERLGLPYASVNVMAAGSFVRVELVSEPLNALRAEHGLPPDPQLEMLSRHLVLSPFPPGFRHPAFPLPATAHAFRPDGGEAGVHPAVLADWGPGGSKPPQHRPEAALRRLEAHQVSRRRPTLGNRLARFLTTGPKTRMRPNAAPAQAPPAWTASRPGAPAVYFTLGTVFNLESGDLFARVLAGLRELPINLLVTVGRQIDPQEFGPQPAHVHIEQYVPQARVLPHCDLVISHGGSGSVGGALAHGLPMVLIPLGADQPLNADRVEALGLGRVLDPVTATPEDVRDAAAAVLADPGPRRAAERLRDEFAALPGPGYAVGLLEGLRTEQIPRSVVLGSWDHRLPEAGSSRRRL